MNSSKTATMKENSGRAGRKKLYRKLSCVLGFFFCTLGIIHLMGVSRSSSERAEEELLSLLDQINNNNVDHRAPLQEENLLMQMPQRKRGTGTVADFLRKKLRGRGRGGNGRGRPSSQWNMNELIWENDSGHRDSNTWKRNVPNVEHQLIIQKILDASMNLVDLVFVDREAFDNAPSDSYAGIYGTFCEVQWDIHKERPNQAPMFKDLLAQSPSCETKYNIDLKIISDLARDYDGRIQTEAKDSGKESTFIVPKVLNLSGVAFHESRCGSTLVANSLIAMNPKKHRVYSESAPPIFAMKSLCDGDEDSHLGGGGRNRGCDTNKKANALRDIIYMMSRSNNPNENRVFLKIQSIGTKFLHVFRLAFPDTPWIFVYREPVQVMMSHLRNGIKSANCLRTKNNPSKSMQDITLRTLGKRTLTSDISLHQFCAAHLAALTETALWHIHDSKGTGVPVEYPDLPDILYEYILPTHFNVPITNEEIENIKQISGVYSKARYSPGKQEWKPDSETKQQMAPPEVRNAASLIMQSSYDELKLISQQKYRNN